MKNIYDFIKESLFTQHITNIDGMPNLFDVLANLYKIGIARIGYHTLNGIRISITPYDAIVINSLDKGLIKMNDADASIKLTKNNVKEINDFIDKFSDKQYSIIIYTVNGINIHGPEIGKLFNLCKEKHVSATIGNRFNSFCIYINSKNELMSVLNALYELK